MKLSALLQERGHAYQYSSSSLEEITDGAKRTLYLGIDPSADSLQVGQLQAFLILRRFLDDGHKVLLLIGGGTGLIGDPGGKNAERPLLTEAEVERNGQAIAAQAKRLFGGASFSTVNNADWLKGVRLLDFLRDVGKHFTVNEMIKREMVRERIENPDQSISYAEFSYMTLQAYDFAHLNHGRDVDLQVGGSDQWGNILSGVELIRRTSGKTAYAFTWPLLVNKSTGRKFGKSEHGTIWLDETKTSIDDFYQFWLNTDDTDVEEYLTKLTLTDMEKIRATLAEHAADKSRRTAQRALAHAVTALVHGVDAANRVESMAKSVREEGANVETLAHHAIPVAASTVVDALVETGLASSKSGARRLVVAKGVRVNGATIDDAEAPLPSGTIKLEKGREVRIIKRKGLLGRIFS